MFNLRLYKYSCNCSIFGERERETNQTTQNWRPTIHDPRGNITKKGFDAEFSKSMLNIIYIV